jgi:hypothetical protein
LRIKIMDRRIKKKVSEKYDCLNCPLVFRDHKESNFLYCLHPEAPNFLGEL